MGIIGRYPGVLAGHSGRLYRETCDELLQVRIRQVMAHSVRAHEFHNRASEVRDVVEERLAFPQQTLCHDPRRFESVG